MYDSGKIIIGILLFLAFVTFPFYNNIGKVTARPDPSIDTPVIQQLKEKECIESKEFMRVWHAQMLNDWKNSALRDGNRLFMASDGRTFNISLQNTCMRCHSNIEQFCVECHNYVAVEPKCWQCHIEPPEVAASALEEWGEAKR